MSDQTNPKRWWQGREGERFWLESTDRLDIGTDLRAPELDGGGKPNWRYDLFKAAQVGDIVLHYDKKPTSQGIVGYSTVAGPWHAAPIVWSARGTYARDRGDVPAERPGYVVPLTNYTGVPTITLSSLRQREGELRSMINQLTHELPSGAPVYFPFEISGSRELRLLQGYAWRLPGAFIRLFPELQSIAPEPSGATALASPIVAQTAARNPPWSRDELILALDLYMRAHGQSITHRSPEVIELSNVLNRLIRLLRPDAIASETYRNPNGVYMKLMNFRRFDPAFTERGHVGLQRGNALELTLWTEYKDDAKRLQAVASAIRNVVINERLDHVADLIDDEEEALEGRLLTRVHHIRERNRRIVQRRKDQALQRYGRLACEACGFDFGLIYGSRGDGFIECHHTKPLQTLSGPASTRLDDLALLCANCHRMIHAKQPWLTLGELKKHFAR